jgi:hypothetical protein
MKLFALAALLLFATAQSALAEVKCDVRTLRDALDPDTYFLGLDGQDIDAYSEIKDRLSELRESGTRID